MFYLTVFLILALVIILGLVSVLVVPIMDMKAITQQYKTILHTDTNREITINSRLKSVRLFVKELNKGLKDLKKIRFEHKNGMDQLKKNIIDLSHDLRTPITAVIGYLDLLEDKETEIQELSIIRKRVEELKTLSEDLFRYALIAEIKERKERLNVVDFLKEVSLSFYASLSLKNLQVNIRILQKEIMIMANREVLNRLFNNIYSNIVKYADDDVTLLVEKDMILFRNHTKSIDKVEIARIFDRFYTVQYQHQGTGLGLYISKTIVESLGYRMSARFDEEIFEIKIDFSKKYSKE